MSDVKIRGLSRDPADPSGRTLLVFLNRAPTDDEFRTIHAEMKVDPDEPLEWRRDRH